MYSFSSSTRNQHPHHGLDPCSLPQGLDPRRKEKKCRKEWRKAATSTGCSSQLFLEELALSLRSGPEQEGEEAQEREEEGRYVYQQ